jgi:anti-sigma regulatory factor (Ser/Thr protein kinase)
MTKKVRIYSTNRPNDYGFREDHATWVPRAENIDYQVVESIGQEILDDNKFSTFERNIISNKLENNPTYISNNKIFHLTPSSYASKIDSVPMLKNLLPQRKDQLRSKRFEVFTKKERHDALRTITRSVPKNYFLNFDQIINLVLDELITNACFAQSSPIPPVRVKYTETEDKVWIQVKDHGGSLTPEKIFKYLGRGLDNLFCEQKKRGSGLGLIFIYYHTTDLIIDIKENKYTKFYVSFKKEKRDKIYYQTPKAFHLFYKKEITMTDREFDVSIDYSPEITTFKFSGSINEDFTFNNLIGERSNKYIFDLESVNLLNSCGIREWIKFINELPEDCEIEYHHCPTVVVLQMNMVKGFLTANAKVISFYAPYYDEEADEEIKVLLKTEQVNDGKAPEVKNDEGNDLEFDGIEATYFKFLK